MLAKHKIPRLPATIKVLGLANQEAHIVPKYILLLFLISYTILAEIYNYKKAR